MTAFASAAGRSRTVPLEVKLPVLATVLLTAAMVATGWASYIEVRSAALQSARSRVEYAAHALAAMLGQEAASTLGRMRDAAANPGLAAYLLSGGVRAEAEARAVLDRVTEETDSLAPAVILSPDGSPLLWSPRDADDDASSSGREELSAAMVGAPADGGFGPVFWTEGRPSAWATVPIFSAHEQVGWLAQMHVLDAELRRLTLDSTDAGAAIRLASTPGELWSTLEGEPLPAPAAWPFAGARAYEYATGEPQLAFATEVTGTAWSVVAELPSNAIRAGVQGFVRRFAMLAAGLILVAAGAAWLLGRGLTRSIRRLRAAARAIVAGQPGEPAALRRGGELGGLAAGLAEAAAQVHARRRELEVQHGDARALAADLVRENAALEQDLAAENAGRAEAEQTCRAALECLARIGEEVRTPIGAIVGYAELVELEVDGPLTPRQRDQIARIRSSGKRLLRLIDEVVDSAATRSTIG